VFALVLAVLLAYRGFKRGGRKIRAASQS
jgi:hypothetical protein